MDWLPTLGQWPGVILLIFAAAGAGGALWARLVGGRDTEGLKLARQVREELATLADTRQERIDDLEAAQHRLEAQLAAQHATNVDIDQRFNDLTHEKALLAVQVVDQHGQIVDLQTRDTLKQTQLDGLRVRLTAALAHIRVLTQTLTAHGHDVPPLPAELADNVPGGV